MNLKHPACSRAMQTWVVCACCLGCFAENAFGGKVTVDSLNTTFEWGGWAQADLIHDFDPAGERDQFVVSSIPVVREPDAEGDGQSSFSLKQSTLTLDTETDTAAGPVTASFLTDFFGSGRAFEVLHAYVEWKGVRLGKSESTFQDADAQPTTLDYEGPDGEVFVQQLLLRYSHQVSDSLAWAVAIEAPDSEIYSNRSGRATNGLPDIPFRVRWGWTGGHVQLAGMLRELRYQLDSGAETTETGWGLSLTGGVELAPRSTFMAQAAYGHGIARYIQAFDGLNADGVLLDSGRLKALEASAVLAGLEHRWNDRFTSTLSADYSQLEGGEGRPFDGIKSVSSVHLNLLWAPHPSWMLGGEIMWGERKDVDGARGDASRVQFSMRYYLP